MNTVTLEDARQRLGELIAGLAPGEEIVIVRDSQPVARLIATAPRNERRLGSMRGTVLYMAPDFDAPLDEFKEYMQDDPASGGR